MSKKTVPGSVWELLGFSTKERLYDDPRFLAYIEDVWNNFLPQGKFKPFCDVNPKTEVLVKGKDGRTVYCVDAATIILMAMMFFEQNELWNSAPYRVMWSYAGKSPFGRGTLDRYSWISWNGQAEKTYEIDAKKMEAQIHTDDFRRIARMRYLALDPQMKTDENWRRVSCLYEGLASCPFVLPNGVVYLKGLCGAGGNPSGQFLTAADNTLKSLHFLACAYIRACLLLRVEVHGAHMWEVLRATVLGDDIAVSPHPEFDQLCRSKLGKNFAEVLGEATWDICGSILESPDWKGVLPMEHGFCAMHFHEMLEPRRHITFRLDWDRQFSAMLQGGQERTPSRQLQRIASYRTVTWGHEPTRYAVEQLWMDYIDWVRKHDPSQLLTTEWKEAEQAYNSDQRLELLYYGGDAPVLVNRFVQDELIPATL